MYVLAQGSTVLQFPYSQLQLQEDNPNTSFPSSMSNEDLANWGVFPVNAQNPPEYDVITETLSEVDPVFENGQWRQAWSLTDASLQEITERLEVRSSLIRQDRNQRLAACDWTQLSDAPVDSSAWATYRQALRDVPGQTSFPWSVQWPEQPGS